MRDLLPTLLAWRAAGDPFVLALVVAAEGGAPRELGAAMAVRLPGGVPAEVVGSVSGGCVEAAVYEDAAEVLAGGRGRLAVYGTSDAEAVGLTCGGTLSVLSVPSTAGTDWLERIGDGSALATVVAGPGELVGRSMWVAPPEKAGVDVAGLDVAGGAQPLPSDHLPHSLFDRYEALSCAVARDATGLIGTGASGLRGYGFDGCPAAVAIESPETVSVFISAFAPPPRLLVLGALDHAAALATLGRFLGYRVTVCDARAAFATAERFPDADEVVVAWPHRYLAETAIDGRTAVCVLTHDPRFDVPALVAALRSPAGYVGAMGSRHSCADRLDRLREEGLSDPELARLRAPIGLDLGAATPAETAVSIAAELIATRNRRPGEPLSRTEGPLHGEPS